jgi:tRNA(fMet)-specific endonuclease VapC
VKYLLDTNVCVDYLTGRFSTVVERVQRAFPDELCISSVVAAELRYGAERSAHRQQNHARLDVLLAELPVVDFDARAAFTYGRLRTELERRGVVIGPNDMLIGAHSVTLELILVTDNTREFRRIKGLRVENWRR